MPYNNADDEGLVFRGGGAVKALGDGRVGGYLIVFGSPDQTDLESDYFDAATDFGTHKSSAVYYHHGMDDTLKTRMLDGGATLKRDDVGVWIETQLKMRDRYEQFLYAQAEAGRLGWSSGTASHLVERERVGKAWRIKRWPLGLDASLTLTPAEPRTRALPLKSLPGSPSLKALLQDAGDASTQREAGAPAPTQARSQSLKEMPSMDDKQKDELETQVEKLVDAVSEITDLAKQVESLVTDVGEIKAKVNAPPLGNPGAGHDPLKGVQVKDVEDPKPFKSLGDQIAAIVRHYTNQGHDVRLDQVQAKAIKAAGMNESVGSEGGFALQNDFTTALLDRLYQPNEPMAILNRVTRQPIGPGANGFTAVMVNETSRATTRRGGMLGYWLPEAGQKTAGKPELRQFELKLGKVAVLSYLTDELIQDAPALEAMIMREGPAELQFQVEDAVVNGNGAGRPLGVLASPCLVTVAKEAGQPAATVVYENIVKMWSRMPGRLRAGAAWFINQDVEPQLFQLAVAVGTGGAPAYLPANGLSDQPFGTLFGRPVIPVEYCPTLGTAGDIIFANFEEYMLIDKGGVESASSIHVNFIYDETVLRFVYRVNGAPLWHAPLTPFKGSNTLSPFVALATRA